MKDALGHGSGTRGTFGQRHFGQRNVIPPLAAHQSRIAELASAHEFSNHAGLKGPARIAEDDNADTSFGIPNWPNLYHAA